MAEIGDSPVPTIVLADDHAIVRSGVRRVLEHAGMQVVAEAEDADGAVQCVRSHHPDVLVLDLNMPGRSSLGAIPEILEGSPGTRVVVLTMQAGRAYARAALSAGASGYVLKEAADTELVAAIRAATRGETYLHPALGAQLAAEPPPAAPDREGLSDREVDVLELLAVGYTNAEIAERLCLSVRTVETHRHNLQHKTRCRSRAQLVRYAMSHRLVHPLG